jgi:hypothetical protein
MEVRNVQWCLPATKNGAQVFENRVKMHFEQSIHAKRHQCIATFKASHSNSRPALAAQWSLGVLIIAIFGLKEYAAGRRCVSL